MVINSANLLVVVVLCIFQALGHQKSDRENDGLTGPVMSVHSQIATFSNNSGRWTEGPQQYYRHDSYSKDGIRVDETKSHSFVDSIDPIKQESSFDNKGNRTLTSYFGPQDRTSRQLKHVHIYDTQNRLIELSYYVKGKQVQKMVTTYNERGHVAQVEYYGREGGLNWRQAFEYEYDGRGNWVKQTVVTRYITKSGKFHSEPVGICYRIVTYYED